MLPVGADYQIDLPRCTALELDRHTSVLGRQRAYRVVEDHFDVVSHRAGQDADQAVPHRGAQPHPFDDLQRGTADVDGVPTNAQLGVRSTSTGR